MTQDQFYLYGTSAVVFHQDAEGGLGAYVLRQGKQSFILDNRLLSAIDYDRHDYAVALSRTEFLSLIQKMGVNPLEITLYAIQNPTPQLNPNENTANETSQPASPKQELVPR
jgi:hypothetical protein